MPVDPLLQKILGIFSPSHGKGSASGSAYDYAFKALDGSALPLAYFRGQVLLVVNTASLCGLTPQYAGLETLYRKYREQGLAILGVPSNDFGWQEPGGIDEISACATDRYHATFALTEKASVIGKNCAPFYSWAAAQNKGGWLAHRPRWNFHKYLIGRDGALKRSFLSYIKPTDPRLVAAIETALAELP